MRSTTLVLAAVCAALFAACDRAAAQVAALALKTMTSENGMSDNYVLCALQDSHGFLWFGTRDGLNRFDGYTFTVYRPHPDIPGSLADCSARCIYEDRRGRLWVGTHSGGLDCFDRITEEFHHYRHSAADTSSIGDGPVAAVCDDVAGALWVVTLGPGGGVSRLDEATGRFTHFVHDPADPSSLSSDDVAGVCRDSSGVLWVATADSGLNRYDPSVCCFVNHHCVPAYGCTLWPRIASIRTDCSGRLWVVAYEHLVYFDPASGSSCEEPFDRRAGAQPALLSTAYTDRAGTRWIASYGRGVVARRPGAADDVILRNTPSVPNSLASNTVFCICQDNAGNIWFGTERGLSMLSRRSVQFRSLRHDPSDSGTIAAPVVRSLALDVAGTLWIGTGGGGLDRLDTGAAAVAHVRITDGDAGPGARVVNTIHLDTAGTLWLGTNRGLVRRSPDGTLRRWMHDPRDSSSIGVGGVWSILRDRAGRLWVGTFNGGINLLDERTGHFRQYLHDARDASSLGDNVVLDLFEARDGTIWVGTDKGLDHFDPATGRFRNYVSDRDDPASLSNNRVWHIHEDAEGMLWIATSGGGVNRMDPATGACRRFMESDGLASNTACAVVEDGRGRIWVSTIRGLSRIDPRDGSIRNYLTGDGLPVYEYHFKSFARGRDGSIYFGGTNGVVAFDPDALDDNTHAPPVVITAFRTSDTAFRLDTVVPAATSATLRHDNNSFAVEFAALDFTNPAGNRYRFMLEGFDPVWREVPAAHRFAEYTNVPPGDYRLLVEGANSDGLWNRTPRVLNISVLPACWQTWWFQVLAAAAAVGLVGAILLARVRGVRRKAQAERRVVQFQLQALRAQMNPHFMFNALNAILHFVMRHDAESAHSYLSTFAGLVRNTLDSVQSDTVSLAEELESISLYLRMESLRFNDRFDVTIDLSPQVDPDCVEIPSMILQPYVENAILHGLSPKEGRGHLAVNISQRLGYLRCSIIDDGVGRRRSQELQRGELRDHRSWGMTVTQNRLEALSRLHGQRYRVVVTDLLDTAGDPAGTRVDILIPVDGGEPSRTVQRRRRR